jgi:hypothetical protein
MNILIFLNTASTLGYISGRKLKRILVQLNKGNGKKDSLRKYEKEEDIFGIK